MLGVGRIGGFMASRSRPRRTKRGSKRAQPKKRAAKAAAGRARKPAAKIAAPGVVETALAAFAHEVRTPYRNSRHQ
jgi:hypothetical protein